MTREYSFFIILSVTCVESCVWCHRCTAHFQRYYSEFGVEFSSGCCVTVAASSVFLMHRFKPHCVRSVCRPVSMTTEHMVHTASAACSCWMWYETLRTTSTTQRFLSDHCLSAQKLTQKESLRDLHFSFVLIELTGALTVYWISTCSTFVQLMKVHFEVYKRWQLIEILNLTLNL